MDAAAVMSLLAVSTGTAHSAATVIITGTATGEQELIDQKGRIHMVVESRIAYQLAENAGITLMVAGAVKEGEDGPETSARSFEVFPE